MLSYLVYVSQRNSNCTDAEIQNILSACERNNTHNEATGVLLYSPSKFVQYLEGSYKQITSLYDKIKEDDRHKNVTLVQIGYIKDRVFPSWQMGAKAFKEDNIDFITELDSSESKLFENIVAGKDLADENVPTVISKFF